MRSSANTPNPRRRPAIRRWIRIVGDDHPRACTGRRLLRLGLARPEPTNVDASWVPIVLDPYANDPLSRADRSTAERVGLLVIDCSWNRLSAAGRLPSSAGRGRAVRRRLPFLVAGNPQHFGRIGELNTVEALGAALYVLGLPAEAADLLGGFAGGAAFLEINRTRLERFSRADDADETRRLERDLFAQM